MKTLQLKDGRTLDLTSKKVVQKDEEASHESEALPPLVPKPQEGMRLEDLPTTPKQMNVINAVIGYRLLGISNSDIVYALGCTAEQLDAVLSSEAFMKCWQMCIDAFVAGQQTTAKDIIAKNAVEAAVALTNIVKTSRNENNKLRAAEAVLNRAGISDAVTDTMSQGLVIKVVRDTPTAGVTIKID